SELYGAVASIERELQIFAPVLRATRVVPGIGPTLAAMPDLLVAGRELVAVAGGSLRLAVPVAQAQPDAPMLEVLLATLAANPEQFVALSERAAAAQSILGGIEAHRLIGPLAEPMAQGQAAVRLLAAGLEMAPALPDLLGMNGARTYLLLVQNNQELR